ncbi:uncharacterized protein LODBEIA_P59760 [Lodderomyces beijingensis]|uniref:Histone-binding protein RBBP4-like N-terminal domain-containing protein n=1 Tax=Lodderomyces beijingensis TaxID=1775926 RepID=A0ABP0ZVT0_9ASCO
MPSSTSNEWAKAERDVILEQQQQEKITNEEFKIWKKTVPLLYDVIHTFALPNPSTVVQWLPKYNRASDDLLELNFVLASNSVSKNDNYVKLSSVTVPRTLLEKGDLPVPVDGEDTSNFKSTLTQWKQASEVNKLRVAKDGNTALSFNSDGVIHAFKLETSEVVDYKYHKQGGFALDWIDNERFLSGSGDGQIALWQLDKPSTPIQLFKSHHGAVNDISAANANIFGSVSDDSTTQFHDVRIAGSGPGSGEKEGSNPYIKIENSHIQKCISFHPYIDTLYATAGKDNVVSLYDLRNYKEPLRKLYGHTDTIRQLEWDWASATTLVSCGYDTRILFWNLDNLDEDFTYPDVNGSSAAETTKRKTQQTTKVDPCLKFVHGGHVNRVNDFSIHPKVRNLFASVGDDKLLEIWKPKSLVVEEPEADEEEEEEEAVEEVEKVGEGEKVEEAVEKKQEVAEKEDEAKAEDDGDAEVKPVETEKKKEPSAEADNGDEVKPDAASADVEMTEASEPPAKNEDSEPTVKAEEDTEMKD